jgi:Peptidase family M28
MAEIAYLTLITLTVTLSNTISVMCTYASENSALDNRRGIFPISISFNDKVESESGETPAEKFTHSVKNQVNSTKLKDSIDILSSFHTRHTKSVYIEDVAHWLKNKFENVCEGRVYFNNFTQIDKGSNYNLKNVICIQEGSATYENNNHILLILAHYDSRMEDINQTNARAPGADDNASGVAAVLELARILSKINLKNDMQFVLLSGEELGQWGSTAYVKHLRVTDTIPDLVMNLDMIGYDALKQSKVLIEYDQGNKSKTNDTSSKKIADLIKQVASKYTNLNASLSKLGKTDLVPFEAAGNTVIGFHDGGSVNNPNYHRMSDTPFTLNIEYLTATTKLALATILELDSHDWQ